MGKIDYEGKYKEKLKQNLENFNIEDKNTLKKIKKFCEKFNFIQTEVKILIKRNKFFKAFFILDPLKQNFYENYLANF